MAINPCLDDLLGGVDVEAWTDEAIAALSTVNISEAAMSSRLIRGRLVSVDIPLDDEPARIRHKREDAEVPTSAIARSVHAGRREPMRRDSMKRREALLKGNEGSRRRQKWENDHFIGNPWAEPPLPIDWEIRPTYPVHAVPYFLAPLWDERQAHANMDKANKVKKELREQDPSTKVPKELREKLKRSKGAKGLLQDLEEEVRGFVRMWEDKEKQLQQQGLADMDSSEDEEIVFVGRNGHMKDVQSSKRAEERLQRDKLVFDSLVDDHGASFGRWLVHSIASYYNLRSWSITTGDPARREAYVGIRLTAPKIAIASSIDRQLPRPLWGLV